MTTTLRMPKLAVSMQEGQLLEWLAADGQAVAEGQPIYTVEIEKAAMEVNAPVSGVFRHIGQLGTAYKVGEIIAEIVPA
jgi:pyruvate/2-oxoglutarate dehydrogenase complex dihydrolipoamide acyltransferase (E2) component